MMHIVLCNWKAYQQQDIYDTLCSLGHKVFPFTVPTDHCEDNPLFVEQFCAFLQQHPVDLVFSINYFPIVSDACHELDIPYVAWTCDSPLISLYHESVFHPCNHLFFFDHKDYTTFRDMGVAHAYYLPLAANVERLRSQTPDDGQTYEVSFAGNLYLHNSYDQIADKLPPYLSGYFDCALEAQQQITGGSLLPTLLTDDICEQLEQYVHYEKSERSFSDTRLLFATTVLGFKAASLQRMHLLDSLSLAVRKTGHKLHLFTENMNANLPLLQMHPPIDYHTKLPCLYQNSLVNLNITIPNIQTGLPLRIWDVLGSGGFLLTNAQAEITEWMNIGTHLETFENEEELIDKTQYYLAHDTERQKIAQNGLQLVQENHTLRQRLTTLLTQLTL